ncbi:hypothetical protein SLEP1_g55875 [Rubroshorea leprosula]|uniref:RNase H type-1 domain-containing protein n=1 Tax=Rubroshorea leprosula TaxID=152421 RepID=A0AAV5MHX2_9ROSI|nr:hypothetical protein SLEP1_g55875 [Rubroshorea leprosula]
MPQFETYDGTKDPDDHLHVFCSVMQAQNALNALMCKIFPSTSRGNAQTWYYSFLLNSISLYAKLVASFATKFSSRRLIRKTTSELIWVAQREGESLKNYMNRLNDAVLEIGSFNQAMGLAAIIQEEYALSGKPTPSKEVRSPTWRDEGQNKKRFKTAQNRVPLPTKCVFIDIGSAPDIMYYHCFQSLGLDPALLQKYDDPIYGFNNQPVPMERVLKLNVAFGSIGRMSLPQFGFWDKQVTPLELAQPEISTTQQVMGVELSNYRPDDKARATPTKEVEESNSDVFAWTPADMPGIPTLVAVHKLSTNPLKKPVAQKRRLFGGERLQAIKKELQKLLQAGFVRRVDYCEWVGNLILVKKSNGKWRMCIDYTNLNEAYLKDCHPLPSIDKLVEAAFGNKRLSLLDPYSGYHQVHMASENEGLYQKMMTIVLRAQIDRNLEVYVDDIVVKSLKAKDHLTDLEETFDNLRRHSIKLNPSKCVFGVESGKFLGFLVSRRGIEVNPQKIKAIEEMKPPKSIKDVQRLTGRVATLHKFISKAADRCLPFFKVLRFAAQKDEAGKPKKFEWTPECQTSFDELKAYLSSPPLLTKAEECEILYLYLGISDIVILHKPECSGRLIKWAVELGEFQITFQQRSSVRGQALADFVVEYTSDEENTDVEVEQWTLYVDGAFNSKGSRAGVVLIGPENFRSEHTLKFNFEATNNMAEHEAFLLGLRLAAELKVRSLQPEVLEVSIDSKTSSWIDPIKAYLQDGTVPSDKQEEVKLRRKASRYTLLDGILYKSSYSLPLLCCLTSYEAEYAIHEINEMVELVNKAILEGIKPRLDQLKAKTEAVIPVELGVPRFRVSHFDLVRNDLLLRENLDLLDKVCQHAGLRIVAYKQKIASFYNKRVQP